MSGDKHITTPEEEMVSRSSAERRWSIGTILLVALCAVVSLAVMAIAAVIIWLGPMVEAYVEKHATELVGRKITMDNLSVKLLSGDIRAENVVLYEDDESEEFVSIGSFDADIDIASLLDNHIYISHVALDSSRVALVQDVETFNFSSLVDYLAEHYATDDDAPAGEPWEVTIEDVAVSDGVVIYRDVALAQEWVLSELSLASPCIYLDNAVTRIDASMLINDNGMLEGIADVNISTFDFLFDGKLDGFNIADTYNYIYPVVNLKGIEGVIGAECHLEGNILDILAMNISGDISASKVSLLGPDGGSLLSAEELAVSIDRVNIAEQYFHLHSVTANGYATQLLFKDDGTTNFDSLFYEVPEVTVESSAEALGNDMYDVKERVILTTSEDVAPFGEIELSIEKLALKGGSVRYGDSTMHEPFEYMLNDISVVCDNFTLKDKNRVIIRAQLPKQGRAMLQWEGSLEDFYNQSILAMLSNVDMQALSSYVEYYTAYPVASGNFTLCSQNVVSNGRLNGVNQIGTYNFNVGDKNKGLKAEYDIPVKLGLYVLTDREGHIDIELPISGDVTSPEFSLRKVIWQAIGNVFLKVAVSPFEWMSQDKQDAFRHIDIDILSPGLDSEHYARIDTMVNTLKEDATLAVCLKPRVNYNKAVRRIAELNLKIAYYNATEGGDSGYLDMLDFARINEMKLSGSDIKAFADSMLLARGIEPSHMNTQAKADILYGDMVDAQLMEMINMRNNMITRYVSFQHKDAPLDRFTIDSVDIMELKRYDGKDRYSVTLIIDNQEIEVSSIDDATGNKSSDESLSDDAGEDN